MVKLYKSAPIKVEVRTQKMGIHTGPDGRNVRELEFTWFVNGVEGDSFQCNTNTIDSTSIRMSAYILDRLSRIDELSTSDHAKLDEMCIGFVKRYDEFNEDDIIWASTLITFEDDTFKPTHNTTNGKQTWDIQEDLAMANESITKSDMVFWVPISKHFLRMGRKSLPGKTLEESKLIDAKKVREYLDGWINKMENGGHTDDTN